MHGTSTNFSSRSRLVQRSSLALPIAGLVACVIAAPFASASAQQSGLAISPFMTFLPASGASPLAGLALTLGATRSLALRLGGQLSLDNTNTLGLTGSDAVRPWSADADALLQLGRSLGTIAPYAFAGVGKRGGPDAQYSTGETNWSYGAGLSLPLGSAIDLFGESRWRMSRFVLPSAYGAPSPTNELRAGVTFHVGGTARR
jgi:hypothetical protein